MEPTIYWQFDPVLLSIGSLKLRWYGLIFGGVFFISYTLFEKICERERQSEVDLGALLYYCIGGMLIGARLAHCLLYDPSHYLYHPLDILKIWEGGLASHGGAVGLIMGLWLYSRRYPVPSFLWLTDRIAIPAALGASLVRVANFLNSEIVGIPTDGTWGVVFARIDALPRHPAQLYEATVYLLIFILLLIRYHRTGSNTPHGLLTGYFLSSVFFTRFLLEFFKTPQAAYEAGFTISVGQWLSVPFFIAGITMLWYTKYRRSYQ